MQHQVRFNNHHSIDIARSIPQRHQEVYLQRWESLIKEIKFLLFPETCKSWSRTIIIRQIIQKCGCIKSKTVTEEFLKFMYRWVVLRNLQEPFILAVVSCAISSTTNRQVRPEIIWVITDDKNSIYLRLRWHLCRTNERTIPKQV